MSALASLLQKNLDSVFNERDAAKRLKAIGSIYTGDAMLFEPDTIHQGHVAICDAVTALLDKLPPSFVFASTGAALGHHGVEILRWRAGPPDGPPAVTGTDVAHIEKGRIRMIHVFLEVGVP